MTGGRAASLLAAAVVAGTLAAALLSTLLFAYGGQCPQWESEGTMAAPASPYGRVMCGPQDPPVVWGVAVATAAGLVAALAGARRARRRVRHALVVLLLPSLLLGLLQLALPQDCVGDQPRAGSCARDREAD